MVSDDVEGDQEVSTFSQGTIETARMICRFRPSATADNRFRHICMESVPLSDLAITISCDDDRILDLKIDRPVVRKPITHDTNAVADCNKTLAGPQTPYKSVDQQREVVVDSRIS